jgi:hypothetical protein
MNWFWLLMGLSLLVYGALWYFSTQDNASLRELLPEKFPVFSKAESDQFALTHRLTILPICILLVALYGLGEWVTRTYPTLPLQWIVWGGVVLSVLSCFTLPFGSSDYSVYTNYGWIQAMYNQNPYVTALEQIPYWQHDPMFRDHWPEFVCAYGPVFAHFCRWIVTLGAGNYLVTLFLFKAVNWVAYGVIGWCLYRGNQILGYPHPNRTLYLYLWNPLIQVQFLANVHSDLLMAMFTTLACYWALAGKARWVLLPLCLGILIKLAPLVALPTALVWLWRNHPPADRAWGIGLAVLGSALSFFPYVLDWQAINVASFLGNLNLTTGSVTQYWVESLLPDLIRQHPWLDGWQPLLTSLFRWGLVGGLLLLMGKAVWDGLRAHRWPAVAWIESAILLQLVLVCLVSTKFYPWYLGMFLPLVFFLGEGHWLRILGCLLSITTLFGLLLMGYTLSSWTIGMFALSLVLLALAVGRQTRQKTLHGIRP